MWIYHHLSNENGSLTYQNGIEPPKYEYFWLVYIADRDSMNQTNKNDGHYWKAEAILVWRQWRERERDREGNLPDWIVFFWEGAPRQPMILPKMCCFVLGVVLSNCCCGWMLQVTCSCGRLDRSWVFKEDSFYWHHISILWYSIHVLMCGFSGSIPVDKCIVTLSNTFNPKHQIGSSIAKSDPFLKPSFIDCLQASLIPYNPAASLITIISFSCSW
jgi:hypothetical protein